MSRTKFFIFVGAGILILILGLIIFGPGRKPPSPEPASLEFWGIRDDEAVWQEIISDFQNKNPHLSVRYQRIDEANYENTLLNALAENRGPDIFMLPNAWIEKHKEKALPLPRDSTPRNFKETFVDIASSELITSEGELLGLPLFTDTLALFYNSDIFNAAGIAAVPKTWDEFENVSRRLTRKSPAGDIIRSGAAIGSSQNVENLLEILSALVMQRRDAIVERGKPPRIALTDKSAEAFRFYASFADPAKQNFSWTNRLPRSLDAFSQEKSALALGFLEDAKRVRAKSPHLSFRIHPLPQLGENFPALTFGKYLALVVSKQTKNPQQAWQFVSFAASREASQKYLEKSGRAPARRDLISLGTKDETLDIFYRQALIAQSWPIPDEKAVRSLFENAVESVELKTASPEEAVNGLRDQLRLLLP